MSLLPRKKGKSESLGSDVSTVPAILLGDIRVPVEVVSTPEAIQKGLSGRRELPESHGMLFIFDHSAQFRFWMRRMYFPLDMIWISDAKKIVDITKNVPPLSFFSKAVFYSPKTFARYVLEVNANFCDTHHITIDTPVQFVSL